MGLDLLVTPLWRFFAGRYQGPVEHLATRIGNPKPDDPEAAARLRAGAIVEGLGLRQSWSDEGDVALSVQYHYRALQALRAFAAAQEYPPDRPFALDGSPETHPSLEKIYHQNAPTRYPHLIDHSDNQGFYLPVDFDAPLPCREVVDGPPDRDPLWFRLFMGAAQRFIAWKTGMLKLLREERRRAKEEARRIAKLRRQSPYPPPPPAPKPPRGKSLIDWHKVGSSPCLLRELDALKGPLGMSRDAGELGPEERCAPEGDPLGDVKYGWAVLRHAARVSVEKGLPLIFDG